MIRGINSKDEQGNDSIIATIARFWGNGVARLLWSEIAEMSLVAVVLPWSSCRYYTVITLLVFWVNSSNHYNKDNVAA